MSFASRSRIPAFAGFVCIGIAAIAFVACWWLAMWGMQRKGWRIVV